MGNKKDLYWEKATSSHIEISVFSDVFTPGKLPLLLAFLKSQMLLSKAVSSLIDFFTSREEIPLNEETILRASILLLSVFPS